MYLQAVQINYGIFVCFSDWFVFFMMTADVFREFHKIRVENFTLTFYLSPKVCTL